MTATPPGPLADTAAGTVLGIEGEGDGEGVRIFRGIPYARAPFGAYRFLPPVPPEPWTGPREATRFGPSAPQPSPEGGIDLLPRPTAHGEDCLTVNVWAPASAHRAPVMVFLHGGAFVSGGSSLPLYDGTAFARDGVVLVTLNYRLGVDGFAWTGEGTPNLGLLDQVAALEWVRDNIAAFGGDPDRVTIFGESAGAMSVGALMAMPRAAGLFRRAIAQSGAGDSAIPPEDALRVARRLGELLGVPATREGFAAVPLEALLRAQTAVSTEISRGLSVRRWGEIARNVMPFEPVIDGEILPELPRDAIAKGVSHDIDLLIGTNAQEANLFFVPGGASRRFSALTAWLVARRYGARARRVRRFYREQGATSGEELTLRVFTDAFYRIPALRVARSHPRSHVYEFSWPSPGYEGALGACHGLELPFVFDTVDKPGFEALLGDAPPASLASAMHDAWVSFARSGDPGWPRYTPSAPLIMRFDAESVVVEDTRDHAVAWGVLDRS